MFTRGFPITLENNPNTLLLKAQYSLLFLVKEFLVGNLRFYDFNFLMGLEPLRFLLSVGDGVLITRGKHFEREGDALIT